MLSIRIYGLVALALIAVATFSSAAAQSTRRPVRIAVLSFGETNTGTHVAAQITRSLTSEENFLVIDRDQSRAAAAGVGYLGSLNMTLEDARNLGAAIGCDFFVTGEAQTLRRSSSDTPVYFEASASVFLVSARTGRLVLWARPEFRGTTPGEAEQALLTSLSAAGTGHRHTIAIRRALEDEREARVRAVEAGTPVIEVMTDDQTDGHVRAPRPYRRLKPTYPEAAALAEVQATVDVLADIDEKGEVGRVEIARWAGYGLDESTLATVRQMHFFPAMRDRVAVPMRVLLRYNFRKPAPDRSQ